MPTLPMNLGLMIPEIALLALGILVLLWDLTVPAANKYRLGWVVVGVLGAITIYLFATPNPVHTRYAAQGLFRIDGFGLFMKRVFALAGLLVSIMSVDYMRRYGRGMGEYFTVIIFALLGMFLVSGVNGLMSMFVSLELVTLSFFILAAFRRQDRFSGEAGIKYVIIGALAAGIMLFGMAFIYGATGQLRFDLVHDRIRDIVAGGGMTGEKTTLLFGLTLLLVGLGFKIASVPFHVWVPDVYQGAPTPVTAFLSVGSKAAGFVLIIRVLTLVTGAAFGRELTALFALLAALTLFYGNLAAIPQANIKRLMGFSSIGHAGYLLLGVVAIVAMKATGGDAGNGITAILFYLLAYVFTNMAAFLAIVIFSGKTGTMHKIDDYRGLSRRSPFLALCFTVALLSLAGVPPLAGFFGKFYLIASVVQASTISGHGWLLFLAAVGAVNVVVSMYYYLLVVKRMYIYEPEEGAASPIHVGGMVKAALFACVIMIFVIGIFQGPFVKMAHAVLATMGG